MHTAIFGSTKLTTRTVGRCECLEVVRRRTEREERMYIITATYQGKRIVRRAYSDLQVFTIVNQLYRDGCTDVGMREGEPD